MISYSKIITPFEQKLKIEKILNALAVYDDRCIKTKIRKYGDNVYTSF